MISNTTEIPRDQWMSFCRDCEERHRGMQVQVVCVRDHEPPPHARAVHAPLRRIVLHTDEHPASLDILLDDPAVGQYTIVTLRKLTHIRANGRIVQFQTDGQPEHLLLVTA